MDTVDNIAIADVLEKAAVELEVHGWCRGTLGTTDGPKCVAGALRQVSMGSMYDNDVYYTDYVPVRQLVVAELQYPLTKWNDQVARDKRQVTRMLRRVAKKLRAQQ